MMDGPTRLKADFRRALAETVAVVRRALSETQLTVIETDARSSDSTRDHYDTFVIETSTALEKLDMRARPHRYHSSPSLRGVRDNDERAVISPSPETAYTSKDYGCRPSAGTYRG